MKKRVCTIIYFLLVALILTPALLLAEGKRVTKRFVVETSDSSIAKGLAVRHKFPGKFSAHLAKAQVNALRRKGIRVRRVKVFHYNAPPNSCTPWPSCKNGSTPTPTPTPPPTGRAFTPKDQTPWGIEAIYNDSSISSTSGGADMNIAILDGGVDGEHPDLKRRVAQCVDFTGKGKKSTRVGTCSDSGGHGTHVAGTALADGGLDGEGIYGVAPDANLLAYKVCKPNGCYTDDIAAAILYARDNGAHIVSMSLGGDYESSLIRDAVSLSPDLLFVAAAGNDGPSEGSIDFPAGNAAIIAVAALRADLTPASFSSRGDNDDDDIIERKEVELAAPGVDIESCIPGGGYDSWDGTSMATPHIAGLAAKVWRGSAAETRSYLHTLVVDLDGVADDPATGFGMPLVP